MPDSQLALLILGAILSVVQVSKPCGGQPPSPVASKRPDVAETLKLLANADGMLIGQNAGHSNGEVENGYRQFIERLETSTGRSPALLGLDYGYDEIPVSLVSSNRCAQRFHAAGGIVSISMHPPNPWHQSHANDVNIGDLKDLLSPGSVAHRRWRETLDRVAIGLTELRDANVVVLWRPFHEMNGGWFWWCPERNGRWPTKSHFQALWRDMFVYFREEKRLDNLLWVYSAAVQTMPHHRSSTYYYPGDAYVDIVGLDWYSDDLNDLDRFKSYSQLVALGKPLGLTEFGPSTRRDGSFDNRDVLGLVAKYPRLKFVMYWHSWPGSQMAIIDQQNAPELMQDARIIDREEWTKK